MYNVLYSFLEKLGIKLHSIVLINPGKLKIKVIKEIREINNLSLKETLELVDKAPVLIKKTLSKSKAEKIKLRLEALGAEINLQ